MALLQLGLPVYRKAPQPIDYKHEHFGTARRGYRFHHLFGIHGSAPSLRFDELMGKRVIQKLRRFPFPVV
jgi:hypothetical protein